MLTQAERLIKCRYQMLRSLPFFGRVAIYLKLVAVENDPRILTMATDGKHIFYNPKFVNKLTDDNNVLILAHECLHVVYKHIERARDKKDLRIDLWRYATDYVINGELDDMKIGKFPLVSQFYPDSEEGNKIFGLLDEKYKGKTSEEVYQLLLDEELANENAEGGDGSGDGTDGMDDLLADGNAIVDTDGNPHDIATKAEIAELSKTLEKVVLDATKEALEKDASSVPASIKRWYTNLVSPKITWGDYVRSTLKSSISDDLTYARFNKRYAHTGLIFPTHNRIDHVELAVSLDMSGSIGPSIISGMVSEVIGILGEFQSFKLHLWCFDSVVHNYQVFDTFNNDISTYELKGGGGTSFECNFDHMRDHNINPNLFVMFTDGYPNNTWGDKTLVDNVLFLIFGDTQKQITAPFGLTLHY